MPEQGMGYQIVDIKLNDNTTYKNLTVLNSTCLIMEIDIDVNNITEIKLSK